jgi:hypothetical protein
MGGIAMLDVLGFQNINTYHMNEGHAAFLTLALLEQQTNGGGLPAAMDWDREAVRQVVFRRPDFLTGRRYSGAPNTASAVSGRKSQEGSTFSGLTYP